MRETHDTPPEVSEVLRVAGGVNQFGEAIFRACWGWSRLDWIGGTWEDRDEHGVLLREVTEFRREPKYFPANRWHIERWMPPETYGTPKMWYGPEGGFLQLTPAIARHVARALEYSRSLIRGNRLASRNRFIDKQDRDYDSFADSVLNDGSTITGPVVNVL